MYNDKTDPLTFLGLTILTASLAVIQSRLWFIATIPLGIIFLYTFYEATSPQPVIQKPTPKPIPMLTPELDKLKKVQETSQRIGEFLDWLLNEKHYVIGEWDKHTDLLEPARFMSCGLIEGLLAEYYNINLKKVEEEKEAILNDFRKRTYTPKLF